MTDSNGDKRVIGLRDICEMRLHLAASRFHEHHVCNLHLANGERLIISNDYVRFGFWRISSGETYRPFVLTLCAALASPGGECRFLAGPRKAAYVAVTLAMMAAMYAIAQAMVAHAGMSETDGRWLMAFGGVLILLKSPYWSRSNRLTEFDPLAIPEGLLPAGHDNAARRGE